MMTKIKKNIRLHFVASLLLPCILFAGTKLGADDSVYNKLYSEFSKYNNRLPGSDNFQKCLETLEETLKTAGLTPERQTFNTLIPETEICDFKVNGLQIAPFYPLGPNGAALTSIQDKGVSGPLVWLKDGDLTQMDNLDITGCIALVNFDSPNMKMIFNQGAKAIVFVGDGSESQWRVAKQFTSLPITVPRFYIDKKTAEKYSLLNDNAEKKQAEIRCIVKWRDVVSCNLWVEIPGIKGKEFNLGCEETLVLASTLDTFGVVPDYCPELRSAANAALLGQVACDLAQTKPTRSIFVVFFGSHYAAQDAARTLYYAYYKSEKGGLNTDPLDFREKSYRDELKGVRKKLSILNSSDIMASEDSELFQTLQLIRKKLDGWVDNYNFKIGNIILLQDKYKKNKKPVPEDLVAGEKKLKAEKKIWNDMRRQLQNRKITDKDAFKNVVGKVVGDLNRQEKEIELFIQHNISYQKLAERWQGKKIIGHYGFDFANSKDQWVFNMVGAARVSRTSSVGDVLAVGMFIKNFSTLGDVYESLVVPEWGTCTLNKESLSGLFNPAGFCVPGDRSIPASAASGAGVFGYQLMTVGDPLDHDELPVRVTCDLSKLAPQLKTYFSAIANVEDISQRCTLKQVRTNSECTYYYQGGGKYFGTRFVNFAMGSAQIEGPARNSVSTVSISGAYLAPMIAGNSRSPMTRVNNSGYIFMPNLYYRWIIPNALGFDKSGKLDRYPTELRPDRLFYGYGGGFFTPFNPDSYGVFDFTVLNARNNSKFKNEYSKNTTVANALYYDQPKNFKYLGEGLLMLGSLETNPDGYGVTYDPQKMISLDPVRISAKDYCLLNNSRLDALRKRNIVNDSIEVLHMESLDHLERAHDERKNRKISKAAAHELFSSCLGYRAFNPLKDIVNDMVQAVVLLLLLSVPFAFVMERLVFGFTSIYYQVSGFAVIFIVTFILLYISHPAFVLASTPIVIFLAFIIIIMSALVMYIVMTKFKLEIRAIQGLASTVHGVTSDSSTKLASVLIGISGMRNRPLKTFLTATTVVLLTFTILVFASFSAKIGVVETYLGKGEGVNRVEIRRFSFLEIPKAMINSIQSLYQNNWDIFRRGGAFYDPTLPVQYPGKIVYNPQNQLALELEALTGFEPGEMKLNPNLASFVPNFTSYKGEMPPIWLPEEFAKELKAKDGQLLKICGRDFKYMGVYDSNALSEMTNIDGSKITPPDFKSTFQDSSVSQTDVKEADDTKLANIDINSFIYFSAKQVGLTRYSALESLGGIPNYVVMYPKENADIKKTAQQIGQVFIGPIYAKGSDGASQYFFTKVMEVSGFTEVIVPLLLGGLIIFSSLLGSIVEREKEIFTYSALGLAPPDVGALFFAESSVYAIIGGMGGYLFSQMIAKGLSILASYGLFHPPEMNFSSLSSVMTILVVMITVLLSTIYPALKASKSANPGVARKWRMPKPEDNNLKFEFPFTVSAPDMAGILSFIREHFENHSDASLGNFAANDVKLFQKETVSALESGHGIQAEIYLAPFDLGVAQMFKMYSKPSEIEGINEVVVELEKINGTVGAWLRGNRVFIDELRNQFLLWRSLPVSTVDHYKAESQKIFKDITEETV